MIEPGAWHGMCLKKREGFPWGVPRGFWFRGTLNVCGNEHLEDTMKGWKKALFCLGAAGLVALSLNAVRETKAQNDSQQYHLPEGVYVDLTRDFYEALQGTTEGGKKVYTNDMSDEYLRQIAVSSTFVVRTNLQIIKQQERIIQLLQSIRDRGK